LAPFLTREKGSFASDMRFSILRNRLIFAIPLLAMLQGIAHAQTADPAVELGQVEQNIKDSSDKQIALAIDIEAATKAQQDISDKLIGLAKTLESQQTAVQTADGKLKKLGAESIVIRSTLAEKQDQLSELLAGLQRLEQNPPPALVVEPQNILQALRGAMMFGAVVPEMRDQALDLQNSLHRLEAIKTETEDAKKTQEQALAALALSQSELIKLQAEKKANAINSAKDLEAEKLRAADLAKQAKNLKQLLAALEEEKKKAEALKTAEAKALELEERKKREAMQRPMMVFTEAHGKLDYPVQGDKLKQFGEDNGLGGTSDGLAIAASADSTVISPVDGRVEFAGPFRSYGQLLILNVGEGYLVLLAGMNQISAEIGQSIRAGEPLGQMGKGPSSVALIGSETNNAQPVLYIEFRKNNDPVDSSLWWIGGRKEAMK
jgi:murein hydrolase activator